MSLRWVLSCQKEEKRVLGFYGIFFFLAPSKVRQGVRLGSPSLVSLKKERYSSGGNKELYDRGCSFFCIKLAFFFWWTATALGWFCVVALWRKEIKGAVFHMGMLLPTVVFGRNYLARRKN